MTADELQLLAGSLETVPMAIVVVDLESRYRIWNRAAAELFGIPADQAIGKRPHEVITGQVGLDVTRACVDMLAGRRPPEDVIVYQLPGPKTPFIRAHRSVVRSHDGRIIGAIAHVIDVSDEVRRAAALERSETFLQAIFDHAPVGIALCTPNGFARANAALERMMGYSSAEFVRLTLRALTTSDQDCERLMQLIAAAVADRQPFSIELAHLRKDGREIVALIQGVAVAAPTAEPSCILTYVDLTERHETERALRASEQRFRLFAEKIESLIYFADPGERRVHYFNARQYRDIYGGDPDELARDYESVWRYVHPDDVTRLLAMRAQAFADGFGESDYRILHPVKGERIAHLRLYPTPLDDGRMVAFGIVDDVTEQRRTEAQRIAETIEQRDKLVREVHHRIKNNLQGVAGLLQQTARARPQIAGLLTEVVGQIQAISQVHGLQMRAREAIPLADMLNNVLANAASLLEAKLPVSFAGAALASTRLPEQEAVPVALVVTELATNAIKYRAPDTEARAVLTCRDRSVELAIANRGRLPDGFSLDAIARSTNGLGLVKSLLPRRGGSLSIVQVDDEVVVTLRLAAPAISFEDAAAV